MQRYVQCENQETDNKETKDVVGSVGWADERDNNLREKGK
jgi:hypothetical protein